MNVRLLMALLVVLALAVPASARRGEPPGRTQIKTAVTPDGLKPAPQPPTAPAPATAQAPETTAATVAAPLPAAAATTAAVTPPSIPAAPDTPDELPCARYVPQTGTIILVECGR